MLEDVLDYLNDFYFGIQAALSSFQSVIFRPRNTRNALYFSLFVHRLVYIDLKKWSTFSDITPYLSHFLHLCAAGWAFDISVAERKRYLDVIRLFTSTLENNTSPDYPIVGNAHFRCNMVIHQNAA